MFRTSAALAALFVLLSASQSTLAEEGFVSLFDGKSLNGWHGGEEFWTVEDGAIVGKTDGKIPANTFLISDQSFSNFVLKVKFRLHNHKGNSGIQFRSEEVKANDKTPKYVVKGYQADIADNHYLGILYGEKTGRGIIHNLDKEMQAKVKAAVKEDGWNEYVITANGDHIKQVLNGVTTVDIQDPKGDKKGIIALQLHRGHDMMISFKDIMIKELD